VTAGTADRRGGGRRPDGGAGQERPVSHRGPGLRCTPASRRAGRATGRFI